MFAMQNAAIAYYFKYYIGKEDNVQLFNVIGTVALIVALPLSKPLARRFGNKNVFIASSLISGLFFIAMYLPGEKEHHHHLCAEYPGQNGLRPCGAAALDHDRRLRGLLGMEERAARDRLVFFSRDVRAESRLGHWRRHRRLAADSFPLRSGAIQTATALTGIKLLVSVIPGLSICPARCSCSPTTIDSQTTDVMKTDLKERRQSSERSPQAG